MLYKLNPSFDGVPSNSINCVDGTRVLSIPFDPANTDYQTFKSEINQDQAQLEDSEGVLMSPEEAKAFVKELP
jgi:hypothetical protein